MEISVVIIVKNGAKTISKTLNALKVFKDVVVYDNGSNDATLEICKLYKNVNLIQGDFLGFGPTKNKAASYALNDWIVIVDSDEVIDDILINTLKSKKLDKNKVYILNFHAYYKDIKINHCGWNNQKIKRVYNKTITKFNNNKVHENIILDNMSTELLKGNIKHYSFNSISDFIIKTDRYSTLFAKENVGKKYSSPLYSFLKGTFTFIRTYFIRLGFLDGYAGLLVSISNANGAFYKYLKLYEENKNES